MLTPEACHLMQPLAMREVNLRNRVTISPMQEYAAGFDGLATDFHLVHLGRFALGGAGLVMSEALAVTPEGRVTHADLGLWEDAQIEPLARIVRFLNEHGAAAGAQLLHAGRKAAVQRPWHGYEPLGEADREQRGEDPWQTLGPVAEPALPHWPAPRAMTAADCTAVVEAHADAAARAAQAGFDVLNVHAAHGYLLHSFLSPVSNTRGDAWGGSLTGRMRLVLEIAEAVRAAWPSDRPLVFRLSCIDDLPGGWQMTDTLTLVRALAALGVDMIDCSSRGLTRRGTPVVTPRQPGFQVPLAREVRRETGVPTSAVGLILGAHQAESIVADGDADVVAIGREALREPNWAVRAAVELTGAEAYEREWQLRWGWWLVRRAKSLAAAGVAHP